MTIRFPLTRFLLAALLPITAAWAQTPDPAAGGAADNAAEATDPQPPSEPTLPVGQAVRLGLAALNQLDMHRFDDADPAMIDELNRYVTIIQANDPSNPQLHYLRGAVLAHMGRAGDAIDELNRFVETHVGQTEWRAYRMLGDLLVSEFPMLARAKYRKAQILMPNEPTILFGLSLTSTKTGDQEASLDFAQRAVDATPLNAPYRREYLTHLARHLLAAKRFEDAQQNATLALEMSRSAYERSHASSYLLTALDGQYRTLLQIITTRIQETPENVDLYVELARRTREAIKVRSKVALNQTLSLFDMSLESFPDGGPQALLEERARLLVELEHTEDARQAYIAILDKFPGSQPARQFLEKDVPDSPEKP